MFRSDRRACRSYRGGGDNDTVVRGVSDTLTAVSKVDASSGCLASDCNALRAGLGTPEFYQ